MTGGPHQPSAAKGRQARLCRQCTQASRAGIPLGLGSLGIKAALATSRANESPDGFLAAFSCLQARSMTTLLASVWTAPLGGSAGAATLHASPGEPQPPTPSGQLGSLYTLLTMFFDC